MEIPGFIGNSRVDFREKEVPVPGPGQLLIQVKANALCGSERNQFFEGSKVTPGHEASGMVMAVGEDTKTVVGTPGVIFLMDYCDACRNCKSGNTNQCQEKRGDYGFNKEGGYSPYIVVNESVFFPIDPSIPLTEATMLLDIMGTGGHAIKRAELVHSDIRSVLIAGAGPIGLGVLAMCQLLLGKKVPVYIMDYVSYRLDLAEKLGAIPIDLNESSLEDALKRVNCMGVDAAFDTSGKTVARKSVLNALNQRGVLVCIGHGQELHLEVSHDLIATERAVLGSEYFQYNELERNNRLLKENLAYMQQIITHCFNVKDIQHAFELFFMGNTGKVIIEHA
ncbi:alcohol dehydrogenase catalytic domain-containing protein [Bacillus sp. SD088]|uniref:alcohol dehydrogenase catalytic domain-containing protein n=1 Tax=Bacillus sp. SD088 TaxID=2782012 RepID=UPI001A962B9B|nr:alcohol dehydrogenase catalytic domain-containing protein [Bacillus sp. SD088]MBO0994443.1 alcohol dehydrogenase catalytic domain-containing protein [Bacillus sp. SD088]